MLIAYYRYHGLSLLLSPLFLIIFFFPHFNFFFRRDHLRAKIEGVVCGPI